MGIISDFKAFAMRGNVMDLAVGIIIGAAFGKIISALVTGIIMPLIGLLLGGINVAGEAYKLGDATVQWGAFLQAVIDFTIIAFSIFLIVKLINSLKKKEVAAAPPAPSAEETLLREIRDLLKQKTNN